MIGHDALAGIGHATRSILDQIGHAFVLSDLQVGPRLLLASIA